MEIVDAYKPDVASEANALDPVDHSVTHCVHLQMNREPDMAKLQYLLTRARTRIPGLIELHMGKNDMKMYKGKSENPAGNTHAIVSRHINAQALLVYQKHPDHVALSRFIFEHLSREPTVVDFVSIPSKL